MARGTDSDDSDAAAIHFETFVAMATGNVDELNATGLSSLSTTGRRVETSATLIETFWLVILMTNARVAQMHREFSKCEIYGERSAMTLVQYFRKQINKFL